MIRLEDIFKINFKPINDAKNFLDLFIKTISIYEAKEGIKIFDPSKSESIYFDTNHLRIIDDFLKICYDKFWQNDIKFDPNWVRKIDEDILCSINENEKLKTFSFFFFKSVNVFKDEVLQIFLQNLKEVFLYKDDKNIGIECSFFYVEFGRSLSDFYFDLFISNKVFDIKFFKELEVLLFSSSFSKNITFSKDIKDEILNFFNSNFESKLSSKNVFVIEHFLTKLLYIERKDFRLKNKLAQQYVELSSYFLNSILEKFFDQKLISKDKKTLKYFYPLGHESELSFYVDSTLPCIDNNTNSDIKIFKSENEFNKKLILEKRFLHKSNSLLSTIDNKAYKLLVDLKKNNAFKINRDFLFFIIEVILTKNKNYLLELYEIDILSILKTLNNDSFSSKLLDWVFDFNTNKKFKNDFFSSSLFLEKMLNTLFSKKLKIFDVIKQSCIMSCFEKFYYNWFFDSRGRIYTDSSTLSVQGFSLSRLMVSPFFSEKDILNDENYNLLSKSLFILENEEGKIKPGKFFQHAILQHDLELKSSNNSTYALDASSSGLQMLTLCLRNKNLGEKCGLLTSSDELDIYKKVSNHLVNHLMLCHNAEINGVLEKLPSLKSLISNRKFAKFPIMTIPYNSTLYGRVKQMEKFFIEDSLQKGIFLHNDDLFLAKKFFFYIDKVIVDWCKKEIPECFIFIEKIKKMIFSDSFSNKVITNQFVSYKYNLSLKTSIRKKIGIKKKGQTQKSKISIVYYKPWEKLSSSEKKKVKIKINNSFIANMIHSMDAYIAAKVLRYFIDQKTMIYTIHDCFRIDYHKAINLRDIVYKYYISLFNLNFCKKNNIIVDDVSLETLTINDLKKSFNINFFIKE